MNREVVTKSTEELAAVIERLIALQVSLHAVVREKLEAMRRADTEAMLSGSRRESELTSEIAAMDDQRRQVVSKLCQAVGISPAPGGNSVTLRALAGRLEPGPRERLARLADRLREEMLRLAEANRVVDLVSREMMAHFKVLFSVMMHDGEAAPTYSADGGVGPASGARVLDAVG
ncbi:MAG: flagellar protein FlgN [Phycisphaerae bacterium]|nr:flagellar protein FlgN [Phycisphaerae bacterium]